MKKMAHLNPLSASLSAGLVVGLLSMILVVGNGWAAPLPQEGAPGTPIGDDNCKKCHLDIADSWSHSPHAHAFDDPLYQQKSLKKNWSVKCLLCHTTNY